ncbi:hypothetical protein BJ322DRAFT_1017173 [Thelephora terrestris]|uniref:NADAR domain-containing protein n=1 Tax=Thelephora terrestris TaxID=56493 RepID=A0A9P6LB82_9AGAM|nr:hypothetical protein BJ322DRAFT_1017173 [Thelephora terrestris]
MVRCGNLDHHQPCPVWVRDYLHNGEFPQHVLDGFHRLDWVERYVCGRAESWDESRGRDRATGHPIRGKSRSRSRGRGKYREIERVHQGQHRDHVPSKHDPTLKHVEKKPSQKGLKPALKHKDGRIFFDNTKGPYFGFTTFSDHPVMYNGFKFPTAEHLRLFFKFEEWPDIGNHLRKQPTVAKLWEEERLFADKKSVPRKEDRLHQMEVVLWYKFTQHKSLKKLLLDTGERPITFVSPLDSFWGAGWDGHGKNYLGKALEKTRWRIKTCTPPA